MQPKIIECSIAKIARKCRHGLHGLNERLSLYSTVRILSGKHAISAVEPVGRVPSNYGKLEIMGPSVLVHSDFCNRLPFSLVTVGSLQCFVDLLVKFNGKRKEV